MSRGLRSSSSSRRMAAPARKHSSSFSGIFGRRRRTVGQRHAEHFDGGRHRVGGVHAAAGAGAGTRVLHDLLALLFVDRAGKEFAVALKRRNHVELLVVRAMPGANRAAVHHQRRPVQAAHGDEATRHVLVAAGDRHVRVVPLRRHDRLDRVRDEIARLQREAHAVRAHRDAVAHADRVEPHPDQAGVGDAFLDLLGQRQQVHVAGVAFEPDAGDADLRLVHIARRSDPVPYSIACDAPCDFGWVTRALNLFSWVMTLVA